MAGQPWQLARYGPQRPTRAMAPRRLSSVRASWLVRPLASGLDPSGIRAAARRAIARDLRGSRGACGCAMVSSVHMTLLIDYSSLLYRAFHSLPDTIPMRGVYGFLGMLARLLADRQPARLAIAVDDDWRPAFRVKALPTYKAHRLSDEV